MTRRRATAVAAGLAVASLLAGRVAADPMRPLALPGKAAAAAAAPAAAPRRAEAAPPLGRLIAIRDDGHGRRRALIGERWVGVGERIDRLTVSAIEPARVELDDGRARTSLHLLPPLQPSDAKLAGAPAATPDPRSPTR